MATPTTLSLLCRMHVFIAWKISNKTTKLYHYSREYPNERRHTIKGREEIFNRVSTSACQYYDPIAPDLFVSHFLF